MDEGQALAAFAALAQEHRLRLVQRLVVVGPVGLAAGALAGEVGISASSVSFHLKELTHAGLIQARRDGRSIIYSASYTALSGLIHFLMSDCCQGRPEVCAPAVEALAACCDPKRDIAHA